MTTQVIKKVSKAGKVSYIYMVDGKQVRKSSRLYVASTVTGEFFWGRPDLIGKGYYSELKEQVRNAASMTYEKAEQEALKAVRRAEKKLEEYRSDVYLRKLMNMYRVLCPTLEDAIKYRDKDVEFAEYALESKKKSATKEAIEESVRMDNEWAEKRRKGLEIVRYDISAFI